jgi:Uma2 family endonuclease
VTLEVDGPPVLIIEVLSESTYEADVDLVRGKGYSYARAGVPEYMALDPTGHFLPEGIRAWHLVEGVYRPWELDEDGRWQSVQIDVAIGLEGMLATVYTRDGRRMLREGEIEEELARKDAELERLRRLLADRQGRNE